MNELMKDLLVLQELELHGTRSHREEERRLKLLRKKVPETLLEVFDRWIDRGKRPVALVRGGVCCECHLKIATGVLGHLAHEDQIERCGNCGRILYLPQESRKNSSARMSASRR